MKKIKNWKTWQKWILGIGLGLIAIVSVKAAVFASYSTTDKANWVTERMTKELVLSEDQVKEVGLLNIDYAGQFEVLRKDGDRSDYKELMKSWKADLEIILDDEQYAKLSRKLRH